MVSFSMVLAKVLGLEEWSFEMVEGKVVIL